MSKSELLARIDDIETQLNQDVENFQRAGSASREAIRHMLPLQLELLNLVRGVAELLPDES